MYTPPVVGNKENDDLSEKIFFSTAQGINFLKHFSVKTEVFELQLLLGILLVQLSMDSFLDAGK